MNLNSILKIQSSLIKVTALFDVLEKRILFSEPGLRERLAALPLGALKEERGNAGARVVIRPSFNDLGGLRRWRRLDG